MTDSFTAERKAPQHLNTTGCYIKYIEGKGRGVFARRDLSRNHLIEISPVLLFTADEYEKHGRHTILDHYTFTWRDGRMALALGLGSLFNHSQTPNVTYTLEPETESIRYATTRPIEEGDELCIFYGHKLWFQPADLEPEVCVPETEDDGWSGLSAIENGEEVEGLPEFLEGHPDEIIPDEQLPFVRIKLQEDEAENAVDSVRTELAWVVDIPEPRHTNVLLKWLKQSGHDTTHLAHLKRIRRLDDTTTLLLTTVELFPTPPTLPPDIELSKPYTIEVPQNPALTMESLRAKATFWPTIYAPRKKGESAPLSRGQVRWAWDAMRTVVQEAKTVKKKGEKLPIVAYVPIPYDEDTKASTQLLTSFIAHDTRRSSSHPLRHASLNLVRKLAEYRTLPASATSPPTESTSVPASADSRAIDSGSRNGSHYLLTALTLFISHEPCIMCSMALLHSRVKDVYYLKSMKKTGGCGGSACVPKLEGVNHRFGITHWREYSAEFDDPVLDLDEVIDA